jgi:isoamylase
VERPLPRHGPRVLAGDPGTLAELGYRLTGSSDLYQHDGRNPYASINFVTAHDGFTLNDLVSYNDKHNQANGEDNRDGESHNLSYNFGVEGPTDDPEIIRQREKQKRNFLATLLLSQGVPMICAGDEMGARRAATTTPTARTTRSPGSTGTCRSGTATCSSSRAASRTCGTSTRCFRRRHFFQGRRIRGSELEDITWFRPDGEEMTDEEWNSHHFRCFGMRLGGDAMIEWRRVRGARGHDDTFLLLFNADADDIPFVLPRAQPGVHWDLVFDTAAPELAEGDRVLPGGEAVLLDGRSMMVMCRRLEDADRSGSAPDPSS